MPIINRTRFQAEVSQAFPPIQVRALSSAVVALGASSLPGCDNLVEICYARAHTILETCERQENGIFLVNINAIQAFALLTLYELKRPNLARACMTLGRATLLASVMGLDKVDGPPSMARQWSSWGLRPLCPLPSSPADLEERRRTFWLLYILDAFVSLRTKLGPAFREEVLTLLPCPTDFIEFSSASVKMPSLQEVFSRPLEKKPTISAFAGTAIMISLYHRLLHHKQALAEVSTYKFWEKHHDIVTAISHCKTSLLAEHMKGGEDPLSLATRMNINTIVIQLHEVAFFKVQRDRVIGWTVTEVLSESGNAVIDIAEAVQLGQRLLGIKLECFHQLDRFFIWPMTVAIHACFRMLRLEEVDDATYISSLVILSRAMKDLIDSEHIAPGLLEKVELLTKKKPAPED
ncbi:hypothetical protein TOPH_06361 [Tolypocladium ophioglossoides CBS 100239]|uniref:Xylanolytic transcriptional activator regulatory domain-containing protein n=1 Tax=Tolypocladium ophioglossoides (strain CBS 100239) TaxID=1163406 RepID=A0A0L0N4S6_TOLOC|nr:hypothetical protein TOPH_06361 [Tolypocladium ophioglossoides CBS 100239]